MLTTDTDAVAAETTAPESSTETETAAEPAVEAKAETAATEEAKTDEVPEVNRWAERARKAEKELAALKATETRVPADPNQEQIKAQLKALGFTTREEMDRELAQREQDARIDRELTQLESKFSGSDGRPKFDRNKVLDYAIQNGIANPEIAYKAMHEKEIMDWAVKQAVTKTQGVKTEGSDGSGSTQVGTTNEDLKASIAAGDQSALRTYLKRLM